MRIASKVYEHRARWMLEAGGIGVLKRDLRFFRSSAVMTADIGVTVTAENPENQGAPEDTLPC